MQKRKGKGRKQTEEKKTVPKSSRLMNARTFNCRCRPSAVRGALDTIRHLLSEETVNSLKELNVFHFFDMPPYPQDNVLTLHILRCWDNARRVFRFGGKEVKFHPDHLALILGMPNRGETVVWRKSPSSDVDARQIKDQLMNFFEGASPTIFEQLFLKFLLTNLFFPSSNFSVSAGMLSFCEDVQLFRTHNWPAAICVFIIDQVSIVAAKLRRNQSLGYIQGFVFIITLWFYEHTSVFAPHVPEARPRMLRWPKNHGWTAAEIHEAFRNLGREKVNDSFIDLQEDEQHLLSNPEEGLPSPARVVPHINSVAGPSSPFSHSIGPIFSSEITPEETHTPSNKEFSIIIDLLKGQEKSTLMLQETMNIMSQQMTYLTGMVESLQRTKADKQVDAQPTVTHRSSTRSAKSTKLKRRAIGSPEFTYKVKRRKKIVPIEEPHQDNITVQHKDQDDTKREYPEGLTGDATFFEDPEEVERSLKGVLQSLAHIAIHASSHRDISTTFDVGEDVQIQTESGERAGKQDAHTPDGSPGITTDSPIYVASQSPNPDAYAIVPRVASPQPPLDYPARSVIPVEMQDVIDRCIASYPGVNDIILSKETAVLERRALEDILMNRWFGNEHVDMYASILSERSKLSPEMYKKFLYVSPLYLMLKAVNASTNGLTEGITMESVRENELILFPIINNQHWILLVGELSKRKWKIYDSLPNVMHKAIALEVIQHFANEYKRLFRTDLRKWPLTCPRNVPTQSNSHDCGMFVCKYMEALIQAGTLDWRQHANWQDLMIDFRAQFAYTVCMLARQTS